MAEADLVQDRGRANVKGWRTGGYRSGESPLWDLVLVCTPVRPRPLPPPHLSPPLAACPALLQNQLSGHGKWDHEVKCRFSSRRTTESSPTLRGRLG